MNLMMLSVSSERSLPLLFISLLNLTLNTFQSKVCHGFIVFINSKAAFDANKASPTRALFVLWEFGKTNENRVCLWLENLAVGIVCDGMAASRSLLKLIDILRKNKLLDQLPK